jgi:hypothetical protein
MEIKLLSRLGAGRQKADAQGGRSAPMPPVDDVLATGVEATRSCWEMWRQQLRDDPSRLAEVEMAIHDHYRAQADHLTATLLVDVAKSPELAAHAEAAYEAAAVPLRSPEKKSAR